MLEPEHISDVLHRVMAGAASGMKREPIQVGVRTFKTKSAAVSHFREILNRVEVGRVLERDDLTDVLSLIERHHEREQKVGSGISRIRVVMNPEFRSQRCFWIERTDGTETDFSYLTCIDGKAKSVDAEFRKACRIAVLPQIIEFKQRVFSDVVPTFCAVTGEFLTWDNCHIDHVVPFEELVRMFLSDTGLTPSRDMITESKDRQVLCEFSCKVTESLWQTYHKENAVLRAVHPTFNLTRKRK